MYGSSINIDPGFFDNEYWSDLGGRRKRKKEKKAEEKAEKAEQQETSGVKDPLAGMSRREKKKARKFGINPVTGMALSRKQFKRIKKSGFNEDTGLIMSKKQAKLEYGNVGTRRERNERRGEVQTVRAETGNTFGNSIAKIVGAAKGNPQTQQQEQYEEQEPMVIAPSPKQSYSPDPTFSETAEQNFREADNNRIAYQQEPDPAPINQPTKNNDMMKKVLMYGGVVLAALTIILFVMKKKK